MQQQVSKTTKMILIVEFVFLSYMLYVLSTSLYKSYQVDKFIQRAAEENIALEKANSMLVEDYEYYSSDAYKEKIAKQNFGLIRPGEEVIVLSQSSVDALAVNDKESSTNEKYYYSLSNPQKWFLLFFDRDKFAL